MYSLGEILVHLLLARLLIVRADNIPKSSNYVVHHTDYCPDGGTYFQRAASPNTLDPAPCHLCFFENSAATCWPWSSRCGDKLDQRFHKPAAAGPKFMLDKLDTTIGRKIRPRRSLNNIFTRDSIRSLAKQPEPKNQCTPHKSTFSDGCPPDDWCVGCTVCECDAEGQWQCHILSYCNKEKKKTKINIQNVLPKIPTKKMYHQSNKKLISKNKITPTPMKVDKENIQRTRYKSQHQNAKKYYNNARKPTNNSKQNDRPHTPQNKKPTNKKPLKKRQTTKKSKERKNIAHRNTKSIRTPKKRFMKKNVSTTDRNADNILKESELGQKIVKRVMSTVQKMIEKQIEKRQNKTKVQQNTNSTNKRNIKNKNYKKIKHYDYGSNSWRSYKPQYILRKKRDALDIDLSVIELNEANLANDNLRDPDLSVKRITKKVSFFDFGNSNYTDTNLSDNSTNKNNVTAVYSTTETTSTNKFFVSSSTTNDILYYKYSIDKNSTGESQSEFSTESATKINATIETSMLLEPQWITEKTKTITGLNVEKIKQDARVMNNTEINYLKYKNWERMQILRDSSLKTNEMKLNEPNDTAAVTMNGFMKNNNFSRKDIKEKLYVLNKYSVNKIITNDLKTMSLDGFGTPKNKSYNSLQMLLQNLIKGMNKSMTTPTKLRSKYSLFKYLRNIFRIIFTRKKDNHLQSQQTNEGLTLKILCEDIEACFMNKHNRIALRPKIHDLNAETENIFKTIKIIKGLLHLIKIPLAKENIFKKLISDDIRKLDVILKGTYENSSLTETQTAQIVYVKENIQQFIESVGRFASTLNEIIDILYKNNKKYSCQRNLRLSHKKRKLNVYNKIRNLLVKYNVVQNTFMRKMYELLTDIDKKPKPTHPKPKVDDLDLNNTEIIERYSKNIIDNLRKLKNLAQALSLSGRRKRQTMREDDAIEYLLMLMEYLLKQNHPLDTAPVNDGVDLLIEAIQNAPDIKPIKKKVLYNLPTTQIPTRTTNTIIQTKSYFKQDVSDYDKISKEISSSSEKNITKSSVEIADTEEDTTQYVYYKKYDDYENTTIANDYHTAEYGGKNIGEIKEKENSDKTGFDKLEAAIDDMRKYDVFSSAVEDEVNISGNKTDKSDLNTVTTAEETTFVPIRDYKFDDDSVSNKKPKLDWIEETYSKEIRQYRDDISNTTAPVTGISQTETTTKPEDQNVDISSITAELEDEKKRKAKIAADEVMYRKQLEFLNSLDYGTEKTDFDDSGKDDEKFSGDGYPAYFV